MDPAPVEQTARENGKDTGLQMPGDDTMRDGVWSSESPQHAGSEFGGSEHSVSSRAERKDDERKERPAGSALGPRQGFLPSKSSESRNRVEGSGLGEQGARNASPDEDAGVGHTAASVLQVRCVCCCVVVSQWLLLVFARLSIAPGFAVAVFPPSCFLSFFLPHTPLCVRASTHSCFGLGFGVRG